MSKLRELLDTSTQLPHVVERYELGGGRTYVDDVLIADYYNEYDRELHIYLRDNAERYLALEEAARDYLEKQETEARLVAVADNARSNFSNPRLELDAAGDAIADTAKAHGILRAALKDLEEE